MKIYIAITILFILSLCVYPQDDVQNIDSEIVEIANDANNIQLALQNPTNDIKQKIINTNSGLFINTDIIINYDPINIGFTVGAFYRFEPLKSEHWLLKGNRLDVGLENIFLLNADMIGVYANWRATIFMEIDVRGYYNITYNMLDYGYIGIDDIDNKPNISSIAETRGENANGYLLSITPKFRWLFRSSNIEIANKTTINFWSLGDSQFFLNRNTYEIYKKNDIEIINEFSMLTDISFIKVGPSYSILYVIGTKTLVQSIDLNMSLEKYYLQNSLMLYFDLKSGFYLASTYYQNDAFINIKLGIQYQIL